MTPEQELILIRELDLYWAVLCLVVGVGGITAIVGGWIGEWREHRRVRRILGPEWFRKEKS